jgi:hypothetical protein
VDTHRWFGDVSLDGAHPAAGDAVAELVRMLDVLRPARLDRSRSHARVTSGRGGSSVDVLLAHEAGSDSDVWIVVGEDEATVSWLATHEHVQAGDGDAGRPWTTVLVDAVAAVVRGEYEVQRWYKGRRLVRSTITDRVRGVQLVSTGSVAGLLIPRRAVAGEVRRLDFGCAGP